MWFRQKSYYYHPPPPPPPNNPWNGIGQQSQDRRAAFSRNAFMPRDQSPKSRRGFFTHEAWSRSLGTRRFCRGFAERLKNRELTPDTRTFLLWCWSHVTHTTQGKKIKIKKIWDFCWALSDRCCTHTWMNECCRKVMNQWTRMDWFGIKSLIKRLLLGSCLYCLPLTHMQRFSSFLLWF